jgi:hypothetical protein
MARRNLVVSVGGAFRDRGVGWQGTRHWCGRRVGGEAAPGQRGGDTIVSVANGRGEGRERRRVGGGSVAVGGSQKLKDRGQRRRRTRAAPSILPSRVRVGGGHSLEEAEGREGASGGIGGRITENKRQRTITRTVPSIPPSRRLRCAAHPPSRRAPL